MSLSNWKRLAQKRTETGRMKNQLYDEITEAKIKSKTSDQRITKSFRLDEIIEGLKAQKPKNRPQGPRIRPAQGKPDEIDYAPEVDPYEDMDVEGLLDLQDYVAPQQEKQIPKGPPGAAGPPPKYEMDPSFWNLEEGDESLPPEYSFVEKGEGPLAIEPPPDDDDEDLDRDINRILDSANLPNYDDIEMRLSQPEMTPLKRSIYLESNIKKANSEISSITSKFKTNSTNRLKQAIKKGLPKDVIEKLEREKDMAHKFADTRLKPIQEYRDYLKVQKKKSTKGSGLRTGRGVYFYNDAKELLKKLTLIIGEMEAGNTSVKMRNMGQTILDTLLRTKSINKSQYQKLVKKYFGV